MLPNHVFSDVGGGALWGPVQKLPSWAPAPHLFTCGCSRSRPSPWNAGPTRAQSPAWSSVHSASGGWPSGWAADADSSGAQPATHATAPGPCRFPRKGSGRGVPDSNVRGGVADRVAGFAAVPGGSWLPEGFGGVSGQPPGEKHQRRSPALPGQQRGWLPVVGDSGGGSSEDPLGSEGLQTVPETRLPALLPTSLCSVGLVPSAGSPDPWTPGGSRTHPC